MSKQMLQIAQSSHLDLYWIGAQADCLEIGAKIISDALDHVRTSKEFHFVIEAARFIEYYQSRYPERMAQLKEAVEKGQIEIAAAYSDRLEHFHDGEALIRNVQTGKRQLMRILGYDSQFAFHPDLPGFTEQTPQINKKMHIPYYFAARCFKTGLRAHWVAPDGSRVIFYDFPKHYSYYSIEEHILPYIEQICKDTGMSEPLLLCSAGDCGKVGTFITYTNQEPKFHRADIGETLDYIKKNYEVDFRYTSVCGAISALDNTKLPVISGETPSHWGAEASNALMFQMDKRVTSLLCDAEKYYAITKLLGLSVEYPAEEFKVIKTMFTSSDKRRYTIDSDYAPETIQQWLDFGWRLVCVTHDHNYGGVEGAQSDFDRILYKRTAERCAELTIKLCQNIILENIKASHGDHIIFNTMNWERDELVFISSLDSRKQYVAVDDLGNESPVIESFGRFCFKACGVPSLGYKNYRLIQTQDGFTRSACVSQKKDGKITLCNAYYSLTINSVSGVLENITDHETDLCISGEFLRILAYEEVSAGVDEKIADWPLLDDASRHIESVEITADNAYFTLVTIRSRLLEASLMVEIALYHQEKKISMKPTLYFHGVKDVKIYMTLPFDPLRKNIHYGTPYGAESFGHLMEEYDGLKLEMFAGDEVSEELYRRYREVHYWMAVENEESGFALTSLHGAMDIRPECLGAILVRTFKSCGDYEFVHLNQGMLEWNFDFTSYTGTWEKSRIYRKAFEMLHPLSVRAYETNENVCSLPPRDSWFSTNGVGVLRVLKESDYNPSDIIMRIINLSSAPLELRLSGSLAGEWICVNLDETHCEDPVGKLGAFEIKTMKRK